MVIRRYGNYIETRIQIEWRTTFSSCAWLRNRSPLPIKRFSELHRTHTKWQHFHSRWTCWIGRWLTDRHSRTLHESVALWLSALKSSFLGFQDDSLLTDTAQTTGAAIGSMFIGIWDVVTAEAFDDLCSWEESSASKVSPSGSVCNPVLVFAARKASRGVDIHHSTGIMLVEYHMQILRL